MILRILKKQFKHLTIFFLLQVFLFSIASNLSINNVSAQSTPQPIACGTIYEPQPDLPWYVCGCESGSSTMPSGNGYECCGWLDGSSCNANAPEGMPSSSCYMSVNFNEQDAIISINMDVDNASISDYEPIRFYISNVRDDEIYAIPIDTAECEESSCNFNLSVDTSGFPAEDDEQYRASIMSDSNLGGNGFDFFSCSSNISILTNNSITEGPNTNFFNSLNPLMTQGSPVQNDLSSPGGIVSRVLLFLFPIAGLILFVMIVWGGFEILSKSTSGTKGMEAGKNRITAAIVGFMLLFATYWMAQIIEVIFGIVIV